MSSFVPSATVPSTSSVDGLTFSNVLPLLAPASLPSIRLRVSGAREAVPFRFLFYRREIWPPSTLMIWPVIHDAASGEQEETGVHHVFRLADARERELRDELLREVARGALERRGVGRTRRDRVHADLLRAELAREALREPVDAVLGEAVVAGAHPRGGRRLVHDRAAAALAHRAVARARAQQRAVEVHVHEARVVAPVHLQKRVELHVAEDRGVVDQEVDAAERLHGALGHRQRRLGRADVDLDRERLGAGLADLLRDALAVVLLDLGDHHARALRCESLRVGLADPAARAGHDRHLARDSIQLHFAYSLLRPPGCTSTTVV
jgi:hypothetical protein